MIQTIKQALKTREVRRKLELMILTVFLVRVCAMFPVPGVDASVFKRWISSNANDALNLFSAFTGGSFENFSIFALGITPLITAQIIVQLLGVVLPPINRLQKQGEHGQKVLKMVTKMAALVLAFIQSLCMGIGFQKSGMITGGVFGIAMVTIFMTAGTAVMIWLSTVLTDKAIGEGTSILLMANIVSGFPKQFQSLIMNLTNGKELWVQAVSLVLAASMIIAIMVIIIYMSEGYHPLQVQYSQKMSQSGEDAQTGQIPVRVGIVSVMPIIFASTLLSLPQLLATIIGKGYGSGYSKIFLEMLSQKNWFDKEHPEYAFGMLIYLGLIVFFAFFYLTITFNAAEISDNIRRAGGFVPGLHAGEETELYIQSISRRLTSIGVVLLILVTMVPIIICGTLGINSSISGTSLIIVIGVATDLMQQIKLEVAGRSYTGILCRKEGGK